jgi:hypothetical protein
VGCAQRIKLADRIRFNALQIDAENPYNPFKNNDINVNGAAIPGIIQPG